MHLILALLGIVAVIVLRNLDVLIDRYKGD